VKNFIVRTILLTEKGKLTERYGRKATGLKPGIEDSKKYRAMTAGPQKGKAINLFIQANFHCRRSGSGFFVFKTISKSRQENVTFRQENVTFRHGWKESTPFQINKK